MVMMAPRSPHSVTSQAGRKHLSGSTMPQPPKQQHAPHAWIHGLVGAGPSQHGKLPPQHATPSRSRTTTTPSPSPQRSLSLVTSRREDDVVGVDRRAPMHSQVDAYERMPPAPPPPFLRESKPDNGDKFVSTEKKTIENTAWESLKSLPDLSRTHQVGVSRVDTNVEDYESDETSPDWDDEEDGDFDDELWLHARGGGIRLQQEQHSDGDDIEMPPIPLEIRVPVCDLAMLPEVIEIPLSRLGLPNDPQRAESCDTNDHHEDDHEEACEILSDFTALNDDDDDDVQQDDEGCDDDDESGMSSPSPSTDEAHKARASEMKRIEHSRRHHQQRTVVPQPISPVKTTTKSSGGKVLHQESCIQVPEEHFPTVVPSSSSSCNDKVYHDTTWGITTTLLDDETPDPYDSFLLPGWNHALLRSQMTWRSGWSVGGIQEESQGSLYQQHVRTLSADNPMQRQTSETNVLLPLSILDLEETATTSITSHDEVGVVAPSVRLLPEHNQQGGPSPLLDKKKILQPKMIGTMATSLHGF